jgi:hypothetical protein
MTMSSLTYILGCLIWFSGFREEDLNVIFYQNMPNLHNRYKSTERKISQKKTEYMVPFKIVSDSPAFHSRWLLLLKIEISSIVNCCFSSSQNQVTTWTGLTVSYMRN